MINAEFRGSPEEIEQLLDILLSMRLLETYTRPYISADKTRSLMTATLILPSSPDPKDSKAKQE